MENPAHIYLLIESTHSMIKCSLIIESVDSISRDERGFPLTDGESAYLLYYIIIIIYFIIYFY